MVAKRWGSLTNPTAPKASGLSSPASSGRDSSQTSEEKLSLQARIDALENLLYQCLEKQGEEEEEAQKMVEVASQAQELVRATQGADSELFSSLRMQLKLKNESVKHLSLKVNAIQAKQQAEKKEGEEESAELAELKQAIDLLKQENEELRKAQDAPLAQHPDYR